MGVGGCRWVDVKLSTWFWVDDIGFNGRMKMGDFFEGCRWLLVDEFGCWWVKVGASG